MGGLGGKGIVVCEGMDVADGRACVSIGLALCRKSIKLTGGCVPSMTIRALLLGIASSRSSSSQADP